MPQLARQVGVGEATLRAAIGPQLAAQLRQRADEHRRATLQQTFDDLVSNMKETYRRLVREGGNVSAARVARELGQFGEHDWFMRAFRMVVATTV